jgi:hypothetical protein
MRNTHSPRPALLLGGATALHDCSAAETTAQCPALTIVTTYLTHNSCDQIQGAPCQQHTHTHTDCPSKYTPCKPPLQARLTPCTHDGVHLQPHTCSGSPLIPLSRIAPCDSSRPTRPGRATANALASGHRTHSSCVRRQQPAAHAAQGRCGAGPQDICLATHGGWQQGHQGEVWRPSPSKETAWHNR